MRPWHGRTEWAGWMVSNRPEPMLQRAQRACHQGMIVIETVGIGMYLLTFNDVLIDFQDLDNARKVADILAQDRGGWA